MDFCNRAEERCKKREGESERKRERRERLHTFCFKSRKMHNPEGILRVNLGK